MFDCRRVSGIMGLTPFQLAALNMPWTVSTPWKMRQKIRITWTWRSNIYIWCHACSPIFKAQQTPRKILMLCPIPRQKATACWEPSVSMLGGDGYEWSVGQLPTSSLTVPQQTRSFWKLLPNQNFILCELTGWMAICNYRNLSNQSLFYCSLICGFRS